MRPSSGEVATALYGAWRLMRFDSKAMDYFDKSVDGFWKSFYAAIFWIPVAAILGFLMLPMVPVSFLSLLSALMANIAYLFVLPLVLLGVCNVMGWRKNYIGCIVAFNWSRIFHICLLLPVALIVSTFIAVSADGTSIELMTTGAPETRPSGGLTLFLIGLMLYILAYEVFIYSRSLAISIPAGFAMVIVEFVTALIWNGVHSIITSIT